VKGFRSGISAAGSATFLSLYFLDSYAMLNAIDAGNRVGGSKGWPISPDLRRRLQFRENVGVGLSFGGGLRP